MGGGWGQAWVISRAASVMDGGAVWCQALVGLLWGQVCTGLRWGQVLGWGGVGVERAALELGLADGPGGSGGRVWCEVGAMHH